MAMIDPRETITEESFAIAPELLGKPLARPRRRAGAMAIDLFLVFLLVQAGSLLFAVAAAWVFFRIAGRGTEGGLLRRSWRLTFRVLGALVLFIAVISAWRAWSDRGTPRDTVPGETPPAGVTGVEGFAAIGEVIALRRATTEAEAQQLANRLAERLHRQGLEPPEIREVLVGVALEAERPWAASVAERAVQSLPADTTPQVAAELPPDSLALLYVAAVEAGDSARLAELRPQLGEALAGERIDRLERRTSRLESSNRELQADLAAARQERGIIRFLRQVADDLGLGFGWSGLYFTAFTALWRGQTPGKRLLRIQVLRLDGKPMGWWMSFERFGGYAAGFATGLLGFFQVLWDRNRQGIHDKIAETVVVRL